MTTTQTTSLASSTTSPASRYAAAHSRHRIAEENCAHWDYDGPGYGHECCAELAAAERALRLANRALRSQQVQDLDGLAQDEYEAHVAWLAETSDARNDDDGDLTREDNYTTRNDDGEFSSQQVTP
jgi:hypothetical protein